MILCQETVLDGHCIADEILLTFSGNKHSDFDIISRVSTMLLIVTVVSQLGVVMQCFIK